MKCSNTSIALEDPFSNTKAKDYKTSPEPTKSQQIHHFFAKNDDIVFCPSGSSFF